MELSIDNVSKKYRKKIALNDVNLNLTNSIYGLMGPNGSGKTTLIKIIVNLLNPTSGKIVYKKNDEIIKNIGKLNIGYLPQNFDVFNEFTVYEQLKYFSILKKLEDKEIDKAIQYVLELTNLEDEINTKCCDLSGGMKRRVGIAQAFLGNPDIIILDEPTVGLDPYERIRFKEIIKKVDMTIPIILSTHIIEDISSLCSDVIVLKKGEVVYKGNISSFKHPKNLFVYKSSIENFKIIKEKTIKVRIDDGYKLISNQKLIGYPFLESLETTVDDAYLYICNFDELTNPM